MIGVVFAIACWAVWYLSPQNVSLLVFDKDAIAAGEWWRLWSAHLTHSKYSQLILNSAIIALMGLMVDPFTKRWQMFLSLLIAMPIMTGVLLIVTPDLTVYRGAIGVAAMLAMMGTWFLILESNRFSLGYWLGIMLLLMFVAKVGLETLIMLSPSASKFPGLHIAWLVQCFGVLIGLAFFNSLHQIHATKTAKNKHYRGASVRQRPKGR